MEKNLYTKEHVAARAAKGALGSFAAQVNYGTQFASSGKFSIQCNREFDTYANALAYANSHISAFPGIVLTVSDDTDSTKNGVYLVSHDTVTESNPNGLKLIKLTAAETGPGNLGWGEITEGGIMIPVIDDLTIHNQYVEIQ